MKVSGRERGSAPVDDYIHAEDQENKAHETTFGEQRIAKSTKSSRRDAEGSANEGFYKAESSTAPLNIREETESIRKAELSSTTPIKKPDASDRITSASRVNFDLRSGSDIKDSTLTAERLGNTLQT